MRSHIESTQIIRGKMVTISVGIAPLRANSTARELLRQADDALYLAKNSGRNKVCHADSSADATPSI